MCIEQSPKEYELSLINGFLVVFRFSQRAIHTFNGLEKDNIICEVDYKEDTDRLVSKQIVGVLRCRIYLLRQSIQELFIYRILFVFCEGMCLTILVNRTNISMISFLLNSTC